MGNQKLLSMGVGIAAGLEKASATLLAVQQAKFKMKQSEELLNLKKKSIEADSELLPFQKEKYRSGIDANKAHIAYYSKLATIKEEEAAAKKKQAEQGLDTINALMDNPDLEWSYNTGTGAATISNRRSGDQAITDAEGNIIGYRPRGAVFQPAEKPTGDQPIVDATGKVVGTRPRGAVFQPKVNTDEEGLLYGKPTKPVVSANSVAPTSDETPWYLKNK